MPAPRPRAPQGLEVWAIGTAEELRDARIALAGTGGPFTVMEWSAREPLTGGRFRQYLRLTPRAVTRGHTLLDLEPQQCEIPFP